MKQAFAKIREKANFGVSSYEVFLFIGSLELLAIDDIVIDGQGKANCFLGSSIKPLIPLMTHATETLAQQVWKVDRPIEAMTSERLLRQYYKVHANMQWSYHTKSFFDLGFFPVNPLRVVDHPLGSNCASLVCQSAIFRVFALRNLADVDLEKLLDILKTTIFIKNHAGNVENVYTFSSMSKTV